MTDHFHITVATVVARADRYLLVQETDKSTGKTVFNQPAGHLEKGETVLEAALRETREETGWQVQLEALLGISLYTAPTNGVTYYRQTFLATPVAPLVDAVIDSDIDAVHWLSYEEIVAMSDRMRSPLVLQAIDWHRAGRCYPLAIFNP